VIPWNHDVILWNRDVILWNHVVILVFAARFHGFCSPLSVLFRAAAFHYFAPWQEKKLRQGTNVD
jgi:hypothetical protein